MFGTAISSRYDQLNVAVHLFNFAVPCNAQLHIIIIMNDILCIIVPVEQITCGLCVCSSKLPQMLHLPPLEEDVRAFYWIV